MYSFRACVLNLLCLCIIAKYSAGNENRTYVRLRREGKGCVLPQFPKLGKWNVFEETSTFAPGQTVNHRTILQVTCEENYKLDGDDIIVCTHGKWTAPIGDCLRKCPSRYSNAIITVTCRNNDRRLENCENPTDGTKAKFQCADFYEDRSLERNPVHVCYNGKWNHKLPECTPICGQKSVDDPTLIVGGKNATKGHYPWQVALYNATNKEQLCGGSLLSQRVILTAAHCITNIENGQILPKELYMVAVGKYYREFDHHDDYTSTQSSSILEMHVPRQYKGDTQNFFGDIAILITKKTFILSLRVQPVCVDWALSRFPIVINTKKVTNGFVAGWGYTVEHKNPSNVLKELEVPLVDSEQCLKKISEDYTRFLTDDKLCAGFTDAGTSVCKGDSGGGLVVQHKSRYYVIGVVSLSPLAPTQEGGCDSQNYGLYTNVQYYIDSFILDKETLARPVVEDTTNDEDPSSNSPISTTTTTTPSPITEAPRDTCILPEHPNSGKWSVFGASISFSPGTTVSRGTILMVSCNNGYMLSGNNITLCENGVWQSPLGQCLLGCPPLHSTETTHITCTYKDKELNDCTDPPDGTVAKQKCAPFYEDLQLAKNPIRVCRNGSWDTSRSDCAPICGLKSVTAQLLIVNGNAVKKGEYPWQVAIYRGPEKQFICSGALISPKLILTAAHCVTNLTGQIESKDNYMVAVGKLYREFNHPADVNAEISELQNIDVPVEFTGISTNFLADIAVLESKKRFKLSQRVQPVCLDWGLKYANDLNNSTGHVAAWGKLFPNSRHSETLQDIAIPVIPEVTCLKGLSESFRQFVTHGTFCGGYLNQNRSLCDGDSGAALVTKHNGRYYASGIASIAPSSPNGGCDTNQYAIYTKVADYISFILEKDAKTKASAPSDKDCTNSEDCETTTKKTEPASEPTAPRTKCALPEYPEFGNWVIFGVTSTRYKPKMFVSTGTILQISCYKSYKLEGNPLILCENGQWSSNIGKCLKTCSTVKSTSIMKATCIFNNKEVKNCTEPIDGTRVKYECAPFYEDLSLRQNPIHFCIDGSWSNPQPKCVLVCGQKSVQATPLIAKGATVTKGDYPWQVAIYTKSGKILICGGSLLSPKVILTAAQCVTDNEGNKKPKENYIVAVGKYYRRFDDDRDRKETQLSELQEIFIPSTYRGGIQNYHADIAVLISVQPFIISNRVQPVCLDSGNFYSIPTNDTGYITGWGYNSENTDALKELEVPAVPMATCRKNLPENYQLYLTNDKFCAGHFNEGASVCKGDSGSGLVFKHDGKYYITGILSVIPTSSKARGCDSQLYGLYTRVSKHISSFILQKLATY